MALLANLCKVATATTGTGTMTLGSAATGFLTFAQAGISDGDVVSYVIADGNNHEVGYGTYTLSGTTLTRNVINSNNSDALISLSGAATVAISPMARDFGYGEHGLFFPPQASWFSTVIGGPGTVTRTDVKRAGMSQKVTGGTGQDQIHLATRSVSGWGSAWRVRARLVGSNQMAAFPSFGLWIYDSGGGKLQGIIYENASNGGNVHVQQRTSTTVFSANNTTWNTNHPPTWFELELTGGNIKWRVSWDGIIWQEHSYALLNFLAAVTHIGIGGTAFTNDGPTIDPVGFLCTYYHDPDHPAPY